MSFFAGYPDQMEDISAKRNPGTSLPELRSMFHSQTIVSDELCRIAGLIAAKKRAEIDGRSGKETP